MARNKNPVVQYLEKITYSTFKKDEFEPFLKNLGLYEFYKNNIDKKGITFLEEKQIKFLEIIKDKCQKEKLSLKRSYFWANEQEVKQCHIIKDIYDNIFKIFNDKSFFNPNDYMLYNYVKRVINSSELFFLFKELLNKYTYDLSAADYDKVIDFFDGNLRKVFSGLINFYEKIENDWESLLDNLVNQEKIYEILCLICRQHLIENHFFEKIEYKSLISKYIDSLDSIRNKDHTNKSKKIFLQLMEYELLEVKKFLINYVKENNLPESVIEEITNLKRYSEKYYKIVDYLYNNSGSTGLPARDYSRICADLEKIEINFKELI